MCMNSTTASNAHLRFHGNRRIILVAIVDVVDYDQGNVEPTAT